MTIDLCIVVVTKLSSSAGTDHHYRFYNNLDIDYNKNSSNTRANRFMIMGSRAIIVIEINCNSSWFMEN